MINTNINNKYNRFFIFPNYENYHEIHNNNYSINDLKQICKHYKLKISGNKYLLKKRIYNYLHYDCNAIIIQKNYRKFLILKLINLLGPALFKKNCINNTDFYTLDSISNLKFNNFFSYKSENENIWGFNILSIYNLFLKSDNFIALNPYDRTKIDINIFNRIKQIIKISKIINRPININIYEDTEELTLEQKIKIKCLELFQYIDSLGNYTNLNWFITLNRTKLIEFILNLSDIWNYRLQLSEESKKQINYPYGNPFRFTKLNKIYSYNLVTLQKTTLFIIEQFIKKGVTRSDCNLGAIYVLSALTLVNTNAAEAMPWLHQSVAII